MHGCYEYSYFVDWGHKYASDTPVQNWIAHAHHIDHSVAAQDVHEMQWYSFPEVLQKLFHL